MRITYLILISIVVAMSACVEDKSLHVYHSGLEEMCLYVEKHSYSNYFSKSMCYFDLNKFETDSELSNYIKKNYIKEGLTKLPSISIIKQQNLFNKYFNNLSVCENPPTKKSIRNTCKGYSHYCFGVSPIYYNNEDDEYYFSFIIAGYVGLKFKVTHDYKAEIIESEFH